MKKPRTKLIAVLLSFCLLLSVIVLLLFCLLLSSCSKNLKNYFYTEESLKRVAAKALKVKYDEEFEIYDAWVESPSTFHVICWPHYDVDIIFEAEVYKDGSGVYEDEYVKAIVSKQISELLQLKLQKVFEECYVKVSFSWYRPSIDYFKGVTVEDYYREHEDASFYLQIFVNEENLIYDEDKVLEEFECLSSLLDDELMREAGCRCYFVDENTLNECKEYFQQDSKARGNFDYIIDDKAYFGFGFLEGKINKTFEEYNEIRKEVKTNE